MSASKRPVLNVYNASSAGVAGTVAMPEVLTCPIRQDIVHHVHTNIAKNKRQPYAVANNAGEQTSAMSWGTGRAVARIPRVGGGGTSRSGQGTYGNMCRGGRMFAPTKIWRKWHKQTNNNERRVAICSALAASAVPALLMARGHKIDAVPEIPLVLSNTIESTNKTKDALAILAQAQAMQDVNHAKDSKKVRAGKGKMRNRRYVMRRGPLVIYAENNGVERAFRNIPGVELANVDRLSLLQLAPGGHLGRFVIWSQGAVEKLNSVFGTSTTASTQKKYFNLPRATMAHADVSRIINSDEVQSVVRAKKSGRNTVPRKHNPLKNVGALLRLNPHAQTTRRAEIKAQSAGIAKVKLIAPKKKAAKTSDSAKSMHLKRMTHSLAATAEQQGARFLSSFNTRRV